MQEFILVVTRPSAADGLCIEVTLDSGHYFEQVATAPPVATRQGTFFDFTVTASARSDVGRSEIVDLALATGSGYKLPGGYVIDRFNPSSDSGHAGVMAMKIRDNVQSMNTLSSYNYQAVSDTDVQISGTIQGQGGTVTGGQATFDRDYRVFAQPNVRQPNAGEEGRVTSRMLIVARNLATCYAIDAKGCLHVVAKDGPGPIVTIDVPSIVDELPVAFGVRAQADGLVVPPAEIIRGTREGMIASLRLPSRRAMGSTRFLGSDFFGASLAANLPAETLGQRAQTPRGPVTVGELLEKSALELQMRYGLTSAEVSELREKTVSELAARARRLGGGFSGRA